ncbi:MAG: hypothetical protein QOJ76_2276 [Acidobacteriota bacterium]|jgi:hypothetical protein|nr:hypothetical protein [Acidobacteriota bacterium]
MKSLSCILASVALSAALAICAAAQVENPVLAQTRTPIVARTDLSAAERALVEGSREAILQTGITESYFDEHFRVARVVDKPGDRRVVWTFSVNGYVATVSDAVGFYTEGGRRTDTHSIAGTLPLTSDITRTITRPQAERIMRRCIGRFTNPQIEYRAHGADGSASLLLTAQSVVKPKPVGAREARERRQRREREESERRERARRDAESGIRMDEIEAEEGDEDRPVILLGAVDLVTGKCIVGRAKSTP